MGRNWSKLIRRYMVWSKPDTGILFDVTRPDYSDGTEDSVYEDLYYRIEPAASKFVKTKIQGVEFFEMTGEKIGIQPGDVFQATSTSYLTYTVMSTADTEPMIGFKTDLVGRITDGPDDSVSLKYDNVRFAIITVPTIGEGLDIKAVGALGFGIRKAILWGWNRPGIDQGMFLHWDRPAFGGSGTITYTRQIDVVEYRDPLVIINLSDKSGI